MDYPNFRMNDTIKERPLPTLPEDEINKNFGY